MSKYNKKSAENFDNFVNKCLTKAEEIKNKKIQKKENVLQKIQELNSHEFPILDLCKNVSNIVKNLTEEPEEINGKIFHPITHISQDIKQQFSQILTAIEKDPNIEVKKDELTTAIGLLANE